MSARLGVLFVLLLSACVSAKSTGSALVSKTSGHSSQIDAQESAFSLDNYAKRTLLQEPGGRCSDCSTLRRDAYNKTLGAWLLDDLVLERIDFSIQCVVSCANASETVMLASNRTLIPNGTITIARPMTITGFHKGVPTSDGMYPVAEKKAAITCPEGSSQGVFDIQSGGVTIANLEIRDCVGEESDSPVVVGKCEDNAEGVQIHHVEFVNNSHSSQPVAMNAAKSSTCGKLEMSNVNFRDNQAKSSVAIVLLGSATVMKDVRIESNMRAENGTRKAAFVFTASGTQGDNLTIDTSVARRNQMPILRAKSGNIEILNSNFTGNDLGEQDASMFQFPSASKIVIRNCRFENNTGAAKGMIALESDTSTKIINSILTNNTKFGSVVFGTGSELSIWGSNFSANNGTSNGGVIHLANSTANVYWTVFQENSSGKNGGVGYAIESSAFMIRNSDFINNNASAGGCFYIEDSTVDVRKSRFYKNKAGADGGAIRVERGGVICEDSVFEENNSSDEGAAIHVENAKYFKMQSVNFTSTEFAFGSVVRIDKSWKDVIWKNVRFEGGDVELTGAAIYIDDSNVTIDGATFVNNKAPYGGAIYAQKFYITIKNATFINNAATVMGGAISGDNGIITIENTTFTENRSYLGGALHFYNTTLEASEIVFLNNHASEGGGLLCKDSKVTIRPRTGIDGKIPRSTEGNPGYSFGIYARSNTGIDSGGAIDVKDSNLTIAYGTFSNNTASEGGAIQATSSGTTSITISHSWFQENIADVRGGGLAVRSANQGKVSLKLSFANFSRCLADQGGAVFLASVNAVVEECTFVNNTATEGGAAFIRKNPRLIEKEENDKKTADINIAVEDCLFEENNAADRGGALMFRGEAAVERSSISRQDVFAAVEYAKKGFNVALKSVNLIRNQAYRNGGGGVYGEAVGLDMHSVEARENTAPHGGGVYLMRTTVNISSSNIIGNEVESSGGGIMMTKRSRGTFSSTIFQRNKASEDGGGLSLSGSVVRAKNLRFKHNNAASGGGVSLVPGSKRNSSDEKPEVDSKFLCFGCTFSKNKASRSGGGLNIQSQDSGIPVMAQLESCQFEHNSASVYGGGIHFVRPFNQNNCTDWTSCGHLVILGTSFVDNMADRSGGSLLSNDRDRVIFNCSDSEDYTSSLEFINETKAIDLRNRQNGDGFCSQWVYGESCSTKISPLVSSYASECIIKDVKDGNWSEPSSTSIQIKETVPGERLPDIYIECYDEYGNVAKSGDEGFKATLESKERGYLMGTFTANLTEGTGKFTGVRNPSEENFSDTYFYELEISFNLDYLKPIKVLMNVRACRINEMKDSDGVQCKECDATQYNFNPMNDSCEPCDDTLDCSGNYVFPKDNYWHSSPCHVPAQKCLTVDACEETADIRNKLNRPEFGSISTALLNESSCDFSDASKREYRKLQCQEGYEGVLCGSCQKDYGRSLSFACTKCEHPVVSILILVSVCIWLAAITAITIRGSMTIEERLTAIRKQLCDLASHRRFGFEESLPEEDETEEQGERREEKNTKIIQYRSKTLKRSLTGASSSTDASYMIGCNVPTTSVTTTAEATEKIDNLTSAQLAKWKLCEVFKVTINFLQAISVAAVINVEWTTYMLTMFDLSAFAGGASTALVTRAIHCFPWWNGTRYATYIGLVSGLLVPTFVILCMVAFFGFVAYKASKGLYYFVKRSALATLAICYFTYLSITKVAVMVFYCIEVHTDDDFSSDKETYYWALDTSIQCADPDHKGLMAFGGILFVLFSVGFPLISAFVLVLCRKGDGSRDPQWMTDILGFLYRAYKREFVYWESTVMLRKALLSAIAVFSYHLGGHSQGLLASCILSVCLFLQAIYKPYRVEFGTVNNIESLSLLISGITFTLAQFFMKDRTNEAVKVALAVFLMISIIVFFVYLMVRMWVCLIDVLRTDLRVRGALLDEDENSMIVVGSLVVSMLGLSSHSRDSDDDDEDDELAAAELGSMRGKKNDDTMSDKSA